MNSPRIREVMNHGKPQWLVDILAIMGHSEAMLFRHYRERANPREAEAFFGLLPNPDALAAGMAEHRRPKHVPPHLLRRRRLEAASGIPQASTMEDLKPPMTNQAGDPPPDSVDEIP